MGLGRERWILQLKQKGVGVGMGDEDGSEVRFCWDDEFCWNEEFC